MKYQEFILEALRNTETRPSKDDMQFAYIVYNGFNVTPKEALEISTSLNN